MARITKNEGISYYAPDEADMDCYRRARGKSRELNARYLSNASKPTAIGAITGSFIYAHPPDYLGRPTLDYRVREWQGLLKELRAYGVDTVILQASAWKELGECYYGSACLSFPKRWNILDPLLDAVALENMTLFLGGLGSTVLWDTSPRGKALDAICREHVAVFRELSRHAGRFHGLYLSPETGFPGSRQPQRERFINTFYRRVVGEIKALTDGLPVVISPATQAFSENAHDAQAYWHALLHDTSIDIVAPQDSIGTFANQLPHLQSSFKIWQTVCAAVGAHLWVNVEVFESSELGSLNAFAPAPFSRVQHQLAHAGDVGEKVIAWELPYFFSSFSGARGPVLRDAYLASLNRQSCARGQGA